VAPGTSMVVKLKAKALHGVSTRARTSAGIVQIRRGLVTPDVRKDRMRALVADMFRVFIVSFFRL
jgi:hypothetical protein